MLEANEKIAYGHNLTQRDSKFRTKMPSSATFAPKKPEHLPGPYTMVRMIAFPVAWRFGHDPSRARHPCYNMLRALVPSWSNLRIIATQSREDR